MRYNEAIVSEYGTSNLTGIKSPVPYKNLPSNRDYELGYIVRTFAKKVNENVIMEIEYGNALDINQELYTVVVIQWKISGPREDKYNGNTVVESGVENQNKFEIQRVLKENGIDLKKVLPNPLEYWQGH